MVGSVGSFFEDLDDQFLVQALCLQCPVLVAQFLQPFPAFFQLSVDSENVQPAFDVLESVDDTDTIDFQIAFEFSIAFEC